MNEKYQLSGIKSGRTASHCIQIVEMLKREQKVELWAPEGVYTFVGVFTPNSKVKAKKPEHIFVDEEPIG